MTKTLPELLLLCVRVCWDQNTAQQVAKDKEEISAFVSHLAIVLVFYVSLFVCEQQFVHKLCFHKIKPARRSE